jgi:tripartite-type tricarboxylate transporter receptor subunit TctC
LSITNDKRLSKSVHLKEQEPMKSTRFVIRALTAAFALGAATLGVAHAQSYPTRPVTLIVPYPTAGAADIFGRSIAQAMEATLKQTVIVENKPGAAGNVGLTQVARSKPDGYTIGLGTIGSQAINQFIYSQMQFDPATDLVPIALVSTTPNVLVVSANSPWKNLGDVIAAARAAGNKK